MPFSSLSRSTATLVSLSVLQFLIAVDVTVVNIALPSIGDEFDVGPQALTWVVVGYTVTGGGLLMLGGRLSDVLGRRRILILGTGLFGVASLAAGLASSFGMLVAARLLQGVGEALALPAAMSVIVLAFPEGSRRSRALGVWGAVASCGLVLGFVLSGVITEFLGWRWIFLVSIPFVVFVLFAVHFLVPSDKPRTRVSLDVPGAVLLTAAPLLFAFGVVEFGDGPLPVLALLASVAAGASLLWVERRATNPLMPPTVFGYRPRVFANLSTALLSAALSSSFLLFTFHLQDGLGLSPLHAGLMLVPLALCLVAAAVVVPRFLGRWGARVCAHIGVISTAFGMVSIAVAVVTDASEWALVPAMVLIAAGMSFGIIALQYAAVAGSTDDDAGAASGIQRAADQLGGATGVAVFIGIGFAVGDSYVGSATLALVGLAAAALCVRRI